MNIKLDFKPNPETDRVELFLREPRSVWARRIVNTNGDVLYESEDDYVSANLAYQNAQYFADFHNLPLTAHEITRCRNCYVLASTVVDGVCSSCVAKAKPIREPKFDALISREGDETTFSDGPSPALLDYDYYDYSEESNCLFAELRRWIRSWFRLE